MRMKIYYRCCCQVAGCRIISSSVNEGTSLLVVVTYKNILVAVLNHGDQVLISCVILVKISAVARTKT